MKKANYIIQVVAAVTFISIMGGQFHHINTLETQIDDLNTYVHNSIYRSARINAIKTSAMFQYLMDQDKEKLTTLALHIAENADKADKLLARMDNPTYDDMITVLADLG